MSTLERLSHQEELELGRRVRETGDLEARDTLVLHTLPLVAHIAKRYRWSTVDYEDLIQEGRVGLVIAAERWEPRQGHDFGAFAQWWILQLISRLVLEYGDIRIPANVAYEMHKVRRAMNELALSLGRPPSDEEIAAKAGITLKLTRRALQCLKLQVISASHVDTRFAESADTEIVDWLSEIADQEALRADHVLEARQELDAACERLNVLVDALYADEAIAERHRDLFVRFYGLDGRLQKRTYISVSERLGFTKVGAVTAIRRTWEKLQRSGVDMDHDTVLAELDRIATFEKLAHKRVGAEKE